MWTNVQFTGSLAPDQTGRWFTYGWPTSWHVVWYMMPSTPQPGAPEVDWSVAVERANATQCTYWITVVNRTASAVTFEGRYAVLN
jgi:hypothetical protein